MHKKLWGNFAKWGRGVCAIFKAWCYVMFYFLHILCRCYCFEDCSHLTQLSGRVWAYAWHVCQFTDPLVWRYAALSLCPRIVSSIPVTYVLHRLSYYIVASSPGPFPAFLMLHACCFLYTTLKTWERGPWNEATDYIINSDLLLVYSTKS